MPLTLHAAFVPSAMQMLGTTKHLLGKAETWCGEQECDPADLLEARIIDDMFPFTYQVKSVAVHTAGAIEGLRKGVFSPDTSPSPDTFDGLRGAIESAVTTLEGVTVEELEDAIGRDMRFEFREFRLDFAAEDFLLSFSQPNFYFHAATAYDIMRMKGVAVGKRDFSGRLRIRKP